MVDGFGSDVSGKNRTYIIQVRDVAIGVQLLLHKQSLVDYGFIYVIENEKKYGPTGLKVSPNSSIQFAFPDKDEASRTAAHEKALAFLKTAKKPEAEASKPAK